MLTAARALALNASSAPVLPAVPELSDLFNNGPYGFQPRVNDLIMIAGQSGSQKSGFALYWVARMGLPTLYLSADMTPFQASVRLACMKLGLPTEAVEGMMQTPDGMARVEGGMEDLNITFSFGSPITWRGVDTELDAYVELHNAYPEVIVWDNLMDTEYCENDYTAQMEAMQLIHSLKSEIGSTIIVLHHATDKPRDSGRDGGRDPGQPPPRKEIKNGLSEKPEDVLTVATSPNDNRFGVAIVKQRMGFNDPNAQRFIRLQAEPALTRFGPIR